MVILNGEQEFVFQRAKILPEGKTVLLESLNRAYKPHVVSAGDVLEISQQLY